MVLVAVNATRRMRARLPRRGSLGLVLRVTTPSQTTMHVLLMRTTTVSALAELSSTSSSRVPVVPATLAYRDTGANGGSHDGTVPA